MRTARPLRRLTRRSPAASTRSFVTCTSSSAIRRQSRSPACKQNSSTTHSAEPARPTWSRTAFCRSRGLSSMPSWTVWAGTRTSKGRAMLHKAPSSAALVTLAISVLICSFSPAWAQVEARSRGPASGETSFGAASRYYPDDNYRPNRWQLGVQVRNLENGVLLTRVEPGSIADRNGLAAGDTIVTVAGYQVGYVDGQLYDLGDELARNVDRRGRVTALVLRRSDGRLINNNLNFSDVGGGTGGGGDDRNSVRGIIEGRGPYANLQFSRNAVQVVRVLDVSNNNWSNVVVARGVERNPGQVPLNFGVAFDRRDGRNYAADAIIYDGGRQYSTGPVAIDWKPGQTSRVTLQILRDRPIYDPTAWYRSNLGRAPSPREQS